MKFPLETVFAERSALSKTQMQAVWRMYQQDAQTGLIHAAHNAAEQRTFLFFRGILLQSYAISEEQSQLLIGDTLHEQVIAWNTGVLYSLPLSTSCLRMTRLAFNLFGNGITEAVSTAQLYSLIQNKQALPEMQFLHVRWQSSEAMFILPGQGAPAQSFVVASREKIIFTEHGLSLVAGWQEPECTITTSACSMDGAWDDYLLYAAFNWTANYILRRFGELTGRMLVTSVAREITLAAAGRNWQISAVGSAITDDMLFATPQEAADAYSFLLDLIVRHVEKVVGAGLTSIIMREIAASIHFRLRNIMSKYMLLPELILS
jgi:hypothetical protein